MEYKNQIENIAEYVNIKDFTNTLKSLYAKVKSDSTFNTFGKTQFVCWSLEDNITGQRSNYANIYEPILSEHRKVHPDLGGRSTGFNTSDSVDKDCYAHTDVDYWTEHPNNYNLVIPVEGSSRIDFFETRPEEIQLPERNAHGEWYYHEFKMRGKQGYEKFQEQRKYGHIIVDRPLLINTNIMHRVVVTEAPRCAWVTRWINIPMEINFQDFKIHVESKLC